MKAHAFCPWCAAALVRREHAGRERAMCDADGCGYVFYDNPLPVVGAIVEHEDEHVVLVRNVGWPSAWFGIVTGFLERDEKPDEGVLREVKEELGLDATIERFVGVFPFVERNELILVYHVKARGPIVQGEELAAFKRVPIAKLRPWPMGTGPAVTQWLAERASRTG